MCHHSGTPSSVKYYLIISLIAGQQHVNQVGNVLDGHAFIAVDIRADGTDVVIGTQQVINQVLTR